MQQCLRIRRHFGSFVLLPVSTLLEPGRISLIDKCTSPSHKSFEVMVTACTALPANITPCICFRLSYKDGGEFVLQAIDATSLQPWEECHIYKANVPSHIGHEGLDVKNFGVTCNRLIQVKDRMSWEFSQHVWFRKAYWSCVPFADSHGNKDMYGLSKIVGDISEMSHVMQGAKRIRALTL